MLIAIYYQMNLQKISAGPAQAASRESFVLVHCLLEVPLIIYSYSKKTKDSKMSCIDYNVDVCQTLLIVFTGLCLLNLQGGLSWNLDNQVQRKAIRSHFREAP